MVMKLNYIKHSSGKFVGYVVLGGKHIFSTGDNKILLMKNIMQQLYTKQNIVGLKADSFDMSNVEESEFPFDKMSATMQTKLYNKSNNNLRCKKFIGRVEPSALPRMEDIKPTRKSNDDTCIYKVKDGKLIVYKIIAEYDITE